MTKKEYRFICPKCGKVSKVLADPDEVEDYESGQFAYRAFPDLEARDRELFISGLCYHCQDKLFGTSEY